MKPAANAAEPEDRAQPTIPKIEAPKPSPPRTSRRSPRRREGRRPRQRCPTTRSPRSRSCRPARRTVALKQAVCPVSDENLGSMGVPIKVTAEGKTFYLCCKGCNKEVDADPKAVVAKLKK